MAGSFPPQGGNFQSVEQSIRDKTCQEKVGLLVFLRKVLGATLWKDRRHFAKQGINLTEQSERGAGFVPGHDLYSVIPDFEARDSFIEVCDVACNDHVWDRKQEWVQSILGANW